ncbi:hypothetical protein AAVH_42179, partial [Aphelenchoides avenae]
MESDSQNYSSPLAAEDVAQTTADSEPPLAGQRQFEHDECSAPDASLSLIDLSDAYATESDNAGEEQRKYAPK